MPFIVYPMRMNFLIRPWINITLDIHGHLFNNANFGRQQVDEENKNYGLKKIIIPRFQRRRYSVRRNRGDNSFFGRSLRSLENVLCYDQNRSKRSRFITLFQAATKSSINLSWESLHP
jgi:hypothetical protein